MDLKDVMGWDEQADLFVSGESSRVRAGLHQFDLVGKDNKDINVLKKRSSPNGKEECGQGFEASSNGLLRSNGVVSSGNGESSHGASMLGFPASNEIFEGCKVPVEVKSNGSEDPQRKLGVEEKVHKYGIFRGENYFSVFIGNLPPFANNRWIFDNFVKIGKVADYYTSGRLSKFNKNHFGFVRFYSIEDANKAVEHFNGTWVDGFKLEVDLARYPKRTWKDEAIRIANFSREEPRGMSKGSYDGIGQSDPQKVWLKPNKTFAQILVGNNDVEMAEVGISNSNRFKVKAKAKECDWLNRSVVAKIKWGTSIRDIKKKLLSHVKGLKAVSRLGIRKVILSFASFEDRNHAIINEDWMGCVEDVGEWSGELVCTDKLWDISCSGIPITAWNIETFRSIAELWGSMVYINDAILLGEDYRMANFVIEAASEIKNSTVDLVVDNNVFQIKVTGSMLENQDGILEGDEIVKWINEGDLTSFDLNYLERPNIEDLKANAVSSEDQEQNLSHPYVNTADERIDEGLANKDCYLEVLEENNVVNVQKNMESVVNISDGIQNIIRDLECTTEEQSLQNVDSRYVFKNQSVTELNVCASMVKRSEDVSKSNNQNVIMIEERQTDNVEDQPCIWAVDSELQYTPNSVALTPDYIDSNICVKSDPITSIQIHCFEVSEKDRSVSKDHVELSLGRSESENHVQKYEMGFKILSDAIYNQQGTNADKLSAAILEDENQTTARLGSSSGVEKEVKAMLELGNLLDIPNVYQFEEAVRDTTSEDIMDEPSSIGGRVKTKRKYAGKSKVHFGGRSKKG